MTLTRLHDTLLPRFVASGESYLNFVLVTVTAFHEWGNELGYTSVSVAVFLVVHIIVSHHVHTVH